MIVLVSIKGIAMCKQQQEKRFLSTKLTSKGLCKVFAAAIIGYTGLVMSLGYLPGRSLTEGEMDILQERFGTSIDYQKIRIHSSKLADSFLTDGFGAVTMENTIIYNSNDYSDDFSKTGLRNTFIHETAHVWQNQNCQEEHPLRIMINSFRANFNLSPEENYDYKLEYGKDLTEFHAEHQASIISDYDSLKNSGVLLGFSNKVPADEIQPLYQSTLKSFLEDPSYPRQNCSWIQKLF